jgi:hypothetical protein
MAVNRKPLSYWLASQSKISCTSHVVLFFVRMGATRSARFWIALTRREDRAASFSCSTPHSPLTAARKPFMREC